MAECSVVSSTTSAKITYCKTCNVAIPKKHHGRNPKYCPECFVIHRKTYEKHRHFRRRLSQGKQPKLKELLHELPCKHCGKIFYPQRKGSKYCSIKCSCTAKNIARTKPRKTPMCSCCGAVFVASETTRLKLQRDPKSLVFCDNECANYAKKWLNKTDEYRERTSFYEKRAEIEAREEQKRKDSFKCCLWCGTAFHSARTWCSDECLYAYSKLRIAAAKRNRYVFSSGWITCHECSKHVFLDSHWSDDRKFCSKRCAARSRRRNRCERVRSARFGRINMHDLRSKQKNKCAMCNQKMTRPDGTYLPTEETLDHIVPLSKGGWHIPSNVRLLCRNCNCNIKRDRVDDGVQLMLPLE